MAISFVCALVAAAAAQSPVPVFDATTLRQPTDLASTWLVQPGDNPAYADPAYDDSHWIRFDPHSDLRNVLIHDRPDVVWYRMHVKVAPNQTGLALEEYALARAYQIYVNGRLLMQGGRVKPYSAYSIGAHLVRPIPDAQIATGSLVIALRVHIARGEWTAGFPGYYSYNALLGQESALRQQIWLTVIGQSGISWLYDFVGLGLGIVALALFSAQRDHKEYLWIFLQFLATAMMAPISLYNAFHDYPAYRSLITEPIILAEIVFSALMYLAFLRMRINRWIGGLLALAGLGLTIAFPLQASGDVSTVLSTLAEVPLLFLVAGLIPILLLVHWRRGNREAGILLIPCVLSSLTIYATVSAFVLQSTPGTSAVGLRLTNLLNGAHMGPFTVTIGQVSDLLVEVCLTLIIVLRATRISRQQALMEGELEAAREVQQVILPDQIETIPGFAIESVYLPAQQVGGDFFQILPIADGGLLLVMGDVAGKGLPAAMLVSVLVGAIRSAADYTTDPAEILANLNERLVGRANGAFSTALAARIDADGVITLANAGHLPPYLNGREVDVAGALPLGVKSGTQYPAMRFLIEAGSRLTFYSDGVVEAQNAKQELFGFDRSRELSMRSAVEVAEAAQLFGQQDDITVVTIAREPVAMPIPA